MECGLLPSSAYHAEGCFPWVWKHGISHNFLRYPELVGHTLIYTGQLKKISFQETWHKGNQMVLWQWNMNEMNRTQSTYFYWTCASTFLLQAIRYQPQKCCFSHRVEWVKWDSIFIPKCNTHAHWYPFLLAWKACVFSQECNTQTRKHIMEIITWHLSD